MPRLVGQAVQHFHQKILPGQAEQISGHAVNRILFAAKGLDLKSQGLELVFVFGENGLLPGA